MGTPDIGDNPVVWLCYVNQLFDIARMAGSHFDHSHFVVVRQAAQGERYADMVVQVAFSVEKVLFGRQDGSQQFLGRCLSVCSGDTDNRTADHFTVAVC